MWPSIAVAFGGINFTFPSFSVRLHALGWLAISAYCSSVTSATAQQKKYTEAINKMWLLSFLKNLLGAAQLADELSLIEHFCL